MGFYKIFSFFNRQKKLNVTSYEKIVVLVGGSGYVGKVLIKEFQEHDKILFVIVSPKTVISGNNTIFLRDDLTKDPAKSVKKILSLVGRVDVLVHMASVYSLEKASFLTKENMMREFEVNTCIPLLVTQDVCTQYWSRYSVQENISKNQKVIVIGSQAGNGKTDREDLITYSATKAALSIAWQFYKDFLTGHGIRSVFLKPAGLQEKDDLDSFVRELKEAILS